MKFCLPLILLFSGTAFAEIVITDRVQMLEIIRKDAELTHQVTTYSAVAPRRPKVSKIRIFEKDVSDPEWPMCHVKKYVYVEGRERYIARSKDDEDRPCK